MGTIFNKKLPMSPSMSPSMDTMPMAVSSIALKLKYALPMGHVCLSS